MEQATAELVADRLLAMRDDEESVGDVTDWVTDWLAVVAAAAVEDDEAGSWLLLNAEYCIERGDLPEHLTAPVRDATDETHPLWS